MQMEALIWDGDVAVIAGYRNDHTETVIDSYDPPGTPIHTDVVKGKDLNIYEVGVEGNFLLCRSLFITGFAKLGTVTHGSYLETASTSTRSSLAKAKIHQGYTKDLSLGGGWLLPCFCLFKIGPMAGYSYDYQQIKMHRTTINGTVIPLLDDLRYEMRWQGPWVGFASNFSLPYCVDITGGYEYHWGHWHANWLLDGPDVSGQAFSDKRHSKHAYGNVVFLKGLYTPLPCWDISIGVKYQYWKATHGREIPRAGSFAAVGLNSTEVDKVKKVLWSSIEVELGLAYQF
jgi:hypothetical protein